MTNQRIKNKQKRERKVVSSLFYFNVIMNQVKVGQLRDRPC